MPEVRSEAEPRAFVQTAKTVMPKLALVLLLCITPAAVSSTLAAPTHDAVPAAAAFLHVQGRDILDASGQPILLRGVNTDTYYYSYIWDPTAPWSYATQADIQYLDSLGVTAIRLGFHWRYFETSLGFDLIDAYLSWCEQAGIYVILDLHVVPPEDDVLDGRIWNNPAAQQQFLNLWSSIATRYAARTIVAGYDLYNEPAPPSAAQWWDLARRAVTAIRAVDANHILFVENPLIEDDAFQLLTDPNVVYSFHDYSPFVVSHADANWVGDTPVPDDYSYPGPVLTGTEWADWARDAAQFTGQTAGWTYWDSGVLTVPTGVKFATLKPSTSGNTGAVWFDDLTLEHNGVPQTLYNPGMEDASNDDASEPASWFFWSDSGFTGEWSDEQAHGGTRSLKTISDGDGFGVWTQSEWILTAPLFTVQTGDTLRVRGWIYAPQNNGGSVSLSLDYLNGVYENYVRAHLLADMQPHLDWGAANNVPLHVGEFGCMSAAPGDSRYNLAADKISVMNEAGLHWAMWTYRDPGGPSFGLYHGNNLDEPLADILRQSLGSPTETSRFGLNAGVGAMDYDPAEMFADVMKNFRQVTQPDGVTPVAKDSKGWPLADCRFLVWHGITRPAETYRLKFIGSASAITAIGATIQNKQYDAPTNTTAADVLLDGSNALYLTFTGTSGGVKNVQLMMPGHTFGETWNHAFLAALAPVKVIRLMDFTATNWNQEVNWPDRTQPDAATQQSTGPGYGWQGKGIAWEYAIDLLNVTNKDGWINIPAEASDAYVAELINLIKNGGNGFAPLEADRKLCIEYSNEVWNGGFDQAQFNHDQAVAEVNAGGSPLNFDGETNDYYWGWRRVGKRIVEISNQFRAAFGDAQMMTRFRPILAWQQNNGQATASNQLDFIQKYYGTSKWGCADPHPVNYYLWGGGGALYYHKKPVAEDLEWQETVITDSKYASAYGIHFCNYEGAMYFDGQEDPDWYQPWVTQRMMDRQQFYEEHGGHLFMFFTLAATWENGLGHVRTIRDLNTPKYNGIVQLSQQTQAWSNTYGAVLPMHSDGGQFSLIGGDWESPHAGATNLSPRAWRAYHFDADVTGCYKVWIEYRSSAAIDLNLHAGSERLATITTNTNGNSAASSQYVFNSADGLKSIRIENWGASAFEIIAVNVELVQPSSIIRVF